MHYRYVTQLRGLFYIFFFILWISQIYVNFYNLKGNLFTHKSMFHDENFPANVPLMEKRTIDWGPSFEKMTVSNNILRSDVIMFLLLKGGGYHRCQFHNSYKGLFTWRWGTPCRWGSPLSRGWKIKCVSMQSYNFGVLGWGFLRLLLHLQLGNLNTGLPSSHLEKDERFILKHVCIY